MLNNEQKQILLDILESKKTEILNYDMGESWANETLEAIECMVEYLQKEI